jgi:hypothetical protein
MSHCDSLAGILTAQGGLFLNNELERDWKNVAITFWASIPKIMKE